MKNRHKLKLGIFASNCSSGRTVTTIPERWSGNWPDNLKLAQLADKTGLDFLIPIGRWKGYGGDTDFQGSTLETITWATALLAATQNIQIFATVHAPLFHPIIAAKQFVTAHHVGGGRFGINIVVGWNEDEFEMFGVEQRQHDERYVFAQEWLDCVQQIWQRDEEFDFQGQYFTLKGVKVMPKPFHGTRPTLLNAGISSAGQDFALRNCDALFITPRPGAPLSDYADTLAALRQRADGLGRKLSFYSSGVITCRPTDKEARDYFQYAAIDNADWAAVDGMIRKREEQYGTVFPPEKREEIRKSIAHGTAGFCLVGGPDTVAAELRRLHDTGLDGLAFSFINYLDELPFFASEVLPRLREIELKESA